MIGKVVTSMHGSNFSCFTGPNHDILMSFKPLLPQKVFRNVFGAVWPIFYSYAVPNLSLLWS